MKKLILYLLLGTLLYYQVVILNVTIQYDYRSEKLKKKINEITEVDIKETLTVRHSNAKKVSNLSKKKFEGISKEHLIVPSPRVNMRSKGRKHTQLGLMCSKMSGTALFGTKHIRN